MRISQSDLSDGRIYEMMRRGYRLANVCVAVDDVSKPIYFLALTAAVLCLLTPRTFPRAANLSAGGALVLPGDALFTSSVC